MPSYDIDSIYEMLLERYMRKGFLTPKAALDSSIRSLIQLGKTREEAIQLLNSSDSPWAYSLITQVSVDQLKKLRAGEQSTHREEVFLDKMDGYRFQQFIATLFQKLGFCNVAVGPAGADEGIDIKMEQKTEVGPVRYVVECKHHTEHIIGRPVVQKLHSALITKSMNKGIIVTSGHFSSDAMHYAEDVGIELIDIGKLKELADKVGLAIYEESVPLQVIDNCYPISSEDSIAFSCCGLLKNRLKGFQDGMAKIESISLALLSAYMIDYSINARFSTSLGVINSINTISTMFLDGENMRTIDEEITVPFTHIKHMLSEIHEGEIKARLEEKGGFSRSFGEVKEDAIERLILLHTKTVSYYGKNNVRYTKTCVPSKRDITIQDMKRVYLPIWTIGFSILKTKYRISVTETSGTLNFIPYHIARASRVPDFNSYPTHCMICYADIGNDAYLCNECGAIVCDEDKFNCKVCGKTICRNDVKTKRKYLVLTEKYCPECAKSHGLAKD